MFQDRQELTELIKSVMEEHQIGIMDAILHICEKHSVEEEVIATLIRQSHKLKEQLRAEAIALRMVKE